MRTPLLFAAAAIVGLVGCSSDGATEAASSGEAPAGALTYYQDIKPIFDAKCQSCHYDGGIGPFDTSDVAALKDYAGLIKNEVVSKVMPPWLAADGCADYVADRSLSDDQIAAVAKWVDDGAYMGTPENEGAALQKEDMHPLSRVDLTMQMATEYTPVAEPDDYHCFVIDWPETEVSYVAGFRANPGNAAVVHHVIAFLADPGQAAEVDAMDEAEPGPGYTCFGSAGGSIQAWLGAWAPGSAGTDYVPGTGIKVEPGSKVVLQVHYNTSTAGLQPDQTSVDFKLEKEVAKEAWIQPWANPQWLGGTGMDIPAASSDVQHSWSYDPTPFLSGGKPITVYSASIHMHQLGQSGRLDIERKGAESECLLDVPRWDFHWQGSYGFEVPKVVNPGDKLRLECHWDNPSMKDVKWGEGTGDEMCLGSYYMSL